MFVLTWGKGKLNTKRCQKITRVDEQEPSVQSAGRARKVQVEKMYLRKPGNWSSLSEQCWCYAIVNLSEEYISESSQIKE